MKILALIVQNKKGVNLFVVSSNTFSFRLALYYSRSLYDFIIKQFKSGKKIERSFLIESSITCICNITKEFIIACLISNYRGIFAGYDALKKANDLFKQYNKNNLIEKKFPEFFSIFDEFLYTREFRLSKLSLNFAKILLENKPNNTEFSQLKKIADCDIFDKFQHVNSELEKNMIANIPLKYAKKQLTQDREDRYITLINESLKLPTPNMNVPDPVFFKQKPERKANFRFAFKCSTIPRKKDSNLKRSSGFDFKKVTKPVSMPINNNVSYVGFSNEEFKRIIKAEPRKDRSRSDSLQKGDNQRDNDDLIDLEYTKTSNFGLSSVKNSVSQAKPYPILQAPNIDLLNDDVIENSEDIKYSRSSGTGSFVGQQNFDSINSITQGSNSNSVVQRGAPSTQIDLLIFEEADNRASPDITPKTSFTEIGSHITLKILEKTIITLQNGKIKELKIFGQVLLEGDISQQNKMILKLLSQIWEDSQCLQKRVTPNSVEVNQIGAFLYDISREASNEGEKTKHNKAKSIFDYIVASKHFKIERIPLMVIYKSFESENKKNNVILTIQYKVNEHIETELKDVEIEAVLDKEVFFDDIQTTPQAFSFQNHVLLWKLNDLHCNNKGKLQMVVSNCNKEHLKMLETIKIIFTVKVLFFLFFMIFKPFFFKK